MNRAYWIWYADVFMVVIAGMLLEPEHKGIIIMLGIIALLLNNLCYDQYRGKK